MGQALYRTHRPLKLSEVVGQEHVTTALLHALKAGTISHAYLFTGPRGVGKTSIARILAHEINDLPYNDESIHLDIIEIDAASNRRIDEIRDLRDKVHIAPTSAKYKVYIIDEVHMLTREAFNALLKTLEEPPAHAVFILATTEVHKLPETIISRTQRYAFKSVALDKVVKHLQSIAQQEKIEIAPDAMELVAAHGEGSFRDSISLLDQVRNLGKAVTLQDVQATLGIAPATLIADLAAALQAHDAVTVAAVLQQAHTQGYEATRLAKQLGRQLREQVLADAAGDQATMLAVLGKLVDVPASVDPVAYLEIILLDAALAGTTQTSSAARPPATTQPAATVTGPHKPAEKVSRVSMPDTPSLSEPAARTPKKTMAKTEPAKEQPKKTTEQTASEPSITASSAAGDATIDQAVWQQVLDQIRKNYSTLYSILKSAQSEFDPGVVRLKFAHAFHQKRAHDPKNRELIAQTVQAVSGKNLVIACVVADKDETTAVPSTTIPTPTPHSATPPETPAAGTAEPLPESPQHSAETPGSDSLDAISNIFGGAELLQS